MKKHFFRPFKWLYAILAFVIIYYIRRQYQANKRKELSKNNQTIRIAAVGDSITAEHTPFAGYSRYLANVIGSEYTVVNFGQSGHTVQRLADLPYTESKNYQESILFRPNIVLVMLGTNDTKPQNWKNDKTFKEDYIDLLESYLSLDSVRKILLLSPPAAYIKPPFKSQINPDNIHLIKDIIREIAEEYKLEYIDLVHQTKDYPEWFYDGVHPTPEGAKQLAGIIYNHLNTNDS